MTKKEKLLKFLESDLEEWTENLEKYDPDSMEHDFQVGEIAYIEYLIMMVKNGKVI